jgi:hypothetical protein
MSETTMAPGAERVTRVDRTEVLHRRAADVLSDLERLSADEERLFRRIEELRGQLLEVGSRWEPVLTPPREAAYGAWRAHGAREHRLELATLAEAPVPPEEER